MHSSYAPWFIEGRTPYLDKEFWALPWRDAERFCKWFVASIPDRIEALEGFVRSTPGFESWRADLSRDSLRDLGPWVARALERRLPNEDDIREAKDSFTVLNPDLPQYIIDDIKNRPVELKWVYADKALAKSVLSDIGTYLGECLRKAGPRCRWARCRDKRDINQNRPLLMWPYEETVGYNPLGTGKGCAWKIIEGEVNQDEFAQLFDRLLPTAVWEPPKYEPIPKREGTPVTTNCPKCGFGFARVKVAEGVYCNHCGHLEASNGA